VTKKKTAVVTEDVGVEERITADAKALEQATEEAGKSLLEKQQEALREYKDRNDAMAAMLDEAVHKAEEVADPDSDVDYGPDYDFLKYDPHDMKPYADLAKHELDHEKFAYRWATMDPRMWPRRMAEGWRPIPNMKKGDSVAVRMPKERAARLKAQVEQRAKNRRRSPGRRFDQQVAQAGGVPFDDDRPVGGQ
jgi:hypothetical protein